MTAVEPAIGPAVDPAAMARLERRWRREREARLESERIAEAGLRRLWEAKEDLDRRVEERTHELAVARFAAEAADRAKTEFLVNVSHRVRTPLQTILSALELARPTTPTERERLEVATTAAHELNRLFTDLLELAECEVDAPEPRPVPVDLGELVDELTATWREPLLAAGLLLVPEAGGTAVLDAERLLRVAGSLLGNALRNATSGAVTLSLRRHDDDVHLDVAYGGPVVDPVPVDGVFEPFVRVGGPTGSASDLRPRGGGIALALAHRLTSACGGTAEARRTRDGGLAVTIGLHSRAGGSHDGGRGGEPCTTS